MSIFLTEGAGQFRKAAAGLVTVGLLDVAAKASMVERMYLPRFLGLEPDEIFAAIAVDFEAKPAAIVENAELLGIPAGNATLVPFLVISDDAAEGSTRSNQGTSAFAATVRDEIRTSLDGRPVFYLVLAAEPVDTIRSAARDCRDLPELSWAALINGAVNSVIAPPPSTANVVEDIIKHDRVPHDAEYLGAIQKVLEESSSDTDLGSKLWKLGCYVADPNLALDPPQRLRLGATWRERLDKWVAPGEDLRERLATEYGDTGATGFAAILDSYTAFGLDYASFDLDALPKAEPKDRLSIAHPIRIRGASAIAENKGIAVWLPGGGTFALLLKGTPTASDQARIEWTRGSESDVAIDAGRRELRITCDVTADEWAYGTLVVNGTDRTPIAVFGGIGAWFPVCDTFEVDPEAQCFRHVGEPRVVAVDLEGGIVGASTLTALSEVIAGEPVEYTASFGSESHRISLIDLGEVGDSPDDEDEDEERDDASDDDGDRGDDEGNHEDDLGPSDDDLESKSQHAPSVPHAKLEIARSREGDEIGTVSFGVADSTGFIVVGGTPRKLLPQAISICGRQFEGLDLESLVLAKPDAMTFVASLSDGRLALDPDPAFESLYLDDLGSDELAEFWDSRHQLFEALAPHGSVHALGAGVARDEARRYVRAYAQLLERAAAPGPFRAEYQRLVLCDSVRDLESEQIYLAPSNPLTVSFLLRFDEAVSSWLGEAATVANADLKSCSPRHLLPAFAIDLPENRWGGGWFEVVGDTPLLWRRYRPMSSTGGGADSDAGYILRRLRHFLRVFPAYKDGRQTLALSFIEPGDDGLAVLTALRNFYKPLSRVSVGTTVGLPRIDLTIVSASRPEILERAMSMTENEVDAVLRDRVSLTVRNPENHGFSFAHITFISRSPMKREPGSVDFSTRASTLYADGLAAAPGRQTVMGRNETLFSWGTFPGRAQKAADSLEGLVRSAAVIVGGMPLNQIVECHTKMPSARVSADFLPEIYSSSIWIVHLDRLLGLEAFAPSVARQFHRYLIDYEDRSSPGRAGLDAITATERVAPYHLALKNAMREIGNPDLPAIDRILNLLNSANGKWALNLLGSIASQVRERIGVVAAILAVSSLDSVFHSAEQSITCILALDELFDQLPTDGRSRPTGKHCDDILLLTVPLVSGTVRVSGRLIEVKYRGTADPEVAAGARLQLEKTHEWLSGTFNGRGASRMFRSRDLSQLIRGAITRGQAFKLVPKLESADLDALEDALERVSIGDFELDLSFNVGDRPFYGELISVEATSSFVANRSVVPGNGQPFSWLRLGRPVLEALAQNSEIPRPSSFESSCVPSNLPWGGEQDVDEYGEAGIETNVSLATDTAAELSDAAGLVDAAEPRLPSDLVSRRQVNPSEDPEACRIATELTAAASNYELNLEPFDPAAAEIGPSIIRFRTKLLGKQTLSGLQSKSLDLAREVGVTEGLLIDQEAYYVTVDVPRVQREIVRYRDYAHLLDGETAFGALNFLLGMAPNGDVRIADLARLPHLLVGGATNSGKSVFLRALVSSLVRTHNPAGLRLLICDPQTVNYEPFQDAPHLVDGRIVYEPLEMVSLLTETLDTEVAQRRNLLREAKVTNALEFYEEGGRIEELPQLVIIIDEFADLVDALPQKASKAEFMQNVKRLAQMGRALGIYLVVATQRPSVQVVTGDIKANLTARVALAMTDWHDSMTILGRKGAESLRDKGDLLFDHAGRLDHLQGFLCDKSDAIAEAERW